MRPWSRRRSEARTLAAFDEALSRPRQTAAEVVWHWRYEAMLAGIAFAVAVPVARRGPLAVAVAAVTAIATAIAGAMIPRTRRWTVANFWRLVTPHRIRAACAQARIHSREGRLPVVTHSTVTARGEQIRLWCRTGTAPEDLASARPLLRSACWATDVEVYRHERYAHIVTLEVIRR